MTKELTSKQPYEAYYISFDFTNDLGAETIASITVDAVDQSTLADESAVILDVSKQVNTDDIVYVWVQSGTSGHDYLITCRIVGSEGSQYELDGILPVLELPAEGVDSRGTFKEEMQDDLAIFYNTDEFAELIDVESPDGLTIIQGIPAIFTFGEGLEYQGADAPGTKGMVQMRASDVKTISAGHRIYRTADTGDEETWRVLGGGRKTSDDLEWIVPISRVTE